MGTLIDSDYIRQITWKWMGTLIDSDNIRQITWKWMVTLIDSDYIRHAKLLHLHGFMSLPCDFILYGLSLR